MSDFSLEAVARSEAGKGVARKLRALGRLPAVFYGPGTEPRSLSVEAHNIERILKKSGSGMNTLIDLSVEGESGKVVVLVKELQRDPALGTALHADLYAVNLTETISVEVPIHLQGTPSGVSMDGGILDQALWELTVECLPTAIPSAIEMDVTKLEIGDSLHVRDIDVPEGVTIRSDAELSVAAVVAPIVVAEPTVEEAPLEEGAEAPEGEAGAEAKPEGEGESADG